MSKQPLTRRPRRKGLCRWGLRRSERRGTTLIETAFVLPIYFMFVLSLVEFGHALMVKNVLRSATRAGARMGATEGRTTSDVTTMVSNILGGAIDADAALVMVKDASIYDSGDTLPTDGAALEALPNLELSNADPRKMFMVRARIAYNDVALVPMPFMQNVVLEGQSFMRHE